MLISCVKGLLAEPGEQEDHDRERAEHMRAEHMRAKHMRAKAQPLAPGEAPERH